MHNRTCQAVRAAYCKAKSGKNAGVQFCGITVKILWEGGGIITEITYGTDLFEAFLELL